MKKVILILLLCSPLGWVAWDESRGLLRDLWDAPIPPGDDEAEKTEKVKDAQAEAQKVLKLSDELVRSAVALEDPPDTSESGSVAQEVASMGRLRKEHKRYVEKAQDKAADLIKTIEDNLARLRGSDNRPHDVPKSARDALMESLAAYEKLDVRDTDRIDSAKAEADWPKLDRDHPKSDLDFLYEKLDRWTPDSPEGELPTTDSVKNHAAAYRGYLDTYGHVKDPYATALVKEARERSLLWSGGVELVTAIKDRKAPAPDRSPDASAGRVRTIAKTTAGENLPDKFVAAARRLARVFCGDMLPEEKLDANVILKDGDIPRPFDRTQLRITWKDNAEPKTLDTSGFNEFNLKVDNIGGFVFKGEAFDLPESGPPLTPTDYSKAVHEYNEERARVKRWSSEDLARLAEVCRKHADVLGRDPKSSGKTLLERIEKLNDVVRLYPVLFSNDSN